MDEGLTREELANVYRRYGFALHRRCALLLRDEALADDALQETFVKLLRSGSGFRSAERPLAWLSRVADRSALDLLRRRRHLSAAKPIDDSVEQIAAPPGIDAEARRLALAILARLDDDEQRLAICAYIDGLTQAEIAAELGVSQPAVSKRLAALKERATRGGLRLPAGGAP